MDILLLNTISKKLRAANIFSGYGGFAAYFPRQRGEWQLRIFHQIIRLVNYF
jgi:hypothetical protein